MLPPEADEGPQPEITLELEGLAHLNAQGGVKHGVAILADVQIGIPGPLFRVALGAAVLEREANKGLDRHVFKLEAVADLGKGLRRPAVIVGLGAPVARRQPYCPLALEVMPAKASPAADPPGATAPETVGGEGIGIYFHPAQAVID